MYDKLMEVLVNISDAKSERVFEELLVHQWPFLVKKAVGSDAGDSLVMMVEGELYLKAGEREKPILFSWEDKLVKWEQDRSISHNLRKAMGAKPGDTVIDATVGFGQDCSYLLHMGFNVIGFERVPILYFLHKSALILSEKDLNLEIHFGHASDSEYNNFPIYFDPMFDDGTKRKAKAKKTMTLLHKIIGHDEDALIEAEKLRLMSSRLVIKKSPRDKKLLDRCNSSWESKAVRFDLYL